MYEYQCRILRVIDGDTVDIDIDLGFGVWMHRERVRLYGIDTPESRTRDLEEKKFGLLAKAYVRDHLPVGSIQTLVTIKDGKGKFGRILGKFKIGDDILNDIMIKEHHAVEYHGQSKEDIQEAHIKNRKYILKENDKA